MRRIVIILCLCVMACGSGRKAKAVPTVEIEVSITVEGKRHNFSTVVPDDHNSRQSALKWANELLSQKLKDRS